MTETWDLFADVADITAWLDASNPAGAHEDSMRVLKLQEEAGEAAASYLTIVGWDPCQSVPPACRTCSASWPTWP